MCAYCGHGCLKHTSPGLSLEGIPPALLEGGKGRDWQVCRTLKAVGEERAANKESKDIRKCKGSDRQGKRG